MTERELLYDVMNGSTKEELARQASIERKKKANLGVLIGFGIVLAGSYLFNKHVTPDMFQFEEEITIEQLGEIQYAK